jgi:hypothetical protein
MQTGPKRRRRRRNRFTQSFCGAEEGKAGKLRDSDSDQSLSRDKEDAKCSSAPVCLRKSVRAGTALPAACVSNGIAGYTPVSTENFSFPVWASRKKCVFHEHVEIKIILKKQRKVGVVCFF